MLLTKENAENGLIVCNMYGYYMTIYDFYKIVDIKNSTVKLKKLKKNSKYYGFLKAIVKPLNNEFYNNKIITKRFNKLGNINMDKYSSSLFLYDDTKEYHEDHAD